MTLRLNVRRFTLLDLFCVKLLYIKTVSTKKKKRMRFAKKQFAYCTPAIRIPSLDSSQCFFTPFRMCCRAGFCLIVLFPVSTIILSSSSADIPSARVIFCSSLLPFGWFCCESTEQGVFARCKESSLPIAWQGL